MKKYLFLLISAGIMISACGQKEKATEENPLLAKWDTPYQIPPFEKVKNEHYMPAFKAAMASELEEIDKIVNSTEEPTFENTILPYVNSGEALMNVSVVFSSANGVNSSEELRNIAKELSPLQSAHYSAISLNEGLFNKIKAVYDKRETLGLDSLQLRVVEEVYKGFERSGANLPADKKEELKKINAEISALQLEFGQNMLKETAAFVLEVDNEKDLSGLTEGQIAEAAARAKKAGKEGKWLFGLDNPSIMPFLANADNRDLREKILTAYLNRCNNNNAEDNKAVIKKLIELRLKKAQIMGYKNSASYILDDRMAKTPKAVYDLLDQIWTPALKVAKAEAADMNKIIAKEGKNIKLEAWDWRYYAQKAMKEKFNLSEDEMAPYFKLENVREGIFYVANKLFGLTFSELKNVPLPNPEAVAFEVKDVDSSVIGLVFFDMFARPGEKRAGAWCSTFRPQSYKDGKRVLPLVTIVGNFTRPVGDKPALLTTDEVTTYFHEFGHGLAGLLSDAKYNGMGGYPRDFVELPSQLNEHWAFEPEVLKVYAKHYKTGEVIPQELVKKMENAGKYGQGFATVEYLAASYLDMDYHVLEAIPADLDVEKFEAKVLNDRNILPQIPSRYRSTYFSHTFTGGYTAGYYSYIWAEVLDADAYEAFVETKDIFNKGVADKYRYQILAKAGEKEAMDLYINFRGKKPGIEPLLKNRGLK